MKFTFIAILFATLLISCSSDTEDVADVPVHQEPVAVEQAKGCRGCHTMKLDTAHDFGCITCHNGTDNLADKELSHKGLIELPAHPDNMEATCGKCHADVVKDVSHSLHFTLKNAVNLVRHAFSANKDLPSLTDIPPSPMPDNITELADDMLRRRCLRCHPYTSGDRYPDVNRGTGCASCHLQFYEGKLLSHIFLPNPTDTQCLQCHYGNRVGFDYYGRYEHDMNDEYRTPYTTPNKYFRPYGVEYHDLSADIHQQKGMVCVDCHFSQELMRADAITIRCSGCHTLENLQKELPENITITGDTYTLHSKNNDTLHTIPLLKNPAHTKYGDTVSCQACHAQWAFNDNQTNMLRSDIDEYDDYERLTVQGSFEVEKLLLNNLDFDAEELPHGMSDKITGTFFPGVWYKGFVSRRWESVALGRDSNNTIQVMRPILDLSLSWVDEDEEVRFDSVFAKSKNNGLLPYVPHTTGKAGLFYRERIHNFLTAEKPKPL